MHVDRLRFLVKQNKWLLPEIAELVNIAPDILKEIERLQAGIETITRMKIMPDDKINRITLAAAIQMAEDICGDDC